MYLLQRWFPLMLSVTGSGGGMWCLQVAPSQQGMAAGEAARVAAVHYSMTQSYLHVESVAS
eukprot:gene12278-12414_t